MIRLGDPAGANRDSVLGMLRTICPEANLRVDPDGTVVVQSAEACRPDFELRSCRCVCEAIEFDRTVTITINAARAAAGNGGLTVDADADATVNGTGSDETVFVDNRGRFAPHPDWIILAHEVCGHALPGMRGTHPEFRPGRPGYRADWHQDAVDRENVVRRERGLPPR